MVANVILPSTLNVLIIGASMIVFGFIFRIASCFWAASPFGQGAAVIY